MRKELVLLMALVSAPLAVIADGDVRPSAPPPPMPPKAEAAPLPPAAAVEAPPAPVVAEAPPPLPVAVVPVRSEGFGSDTRYWVASQILGDQGVTELRPQSGEVASHVYDRYVKSFDYAIPETYQRESFSGGSGGSASTR